MPRLNKRPRSTSESSRATSHLALRAILLRTYYASVKRHSSQGHPPHRQLHDYRRQLFMGPPITRTASKMADLQSPSSQLKLPPSQVAPSQAADSNAAPLDVVSEMTPKTHKTPPHGATEVERGVIHLDDHVRHLNWKMYVLTKLTQEILTLRREAVTQQPAQQPHAEVPEDPAFNWNLLKLPPETRFPVRCTGIVQRVAADLLA